MSDLPSLAKISRRTTFAIIAVNFGGAQLLLFYLNVIDPLPQSASPLRDVEPVLLAAPAVIVAFLILVGWLSGRRREARIARWYGRLQTGTPAAEVPLEVRRSVINMPASSAGLTALMWFVAGVGSALQPAGLRLFLALMGVGGVVSAVMVYFVLDVLWRPILPAFFPDGDIGSVGGFRLSVLGRLMVVFLVVGLLPLVLLVSLTWDRAPRLLTSENPEAILANLQVSQIFIVVAAGLASSLIALAMARGITSRLRALQEAMQRVEQDDLTVQVSVTSNDELGYLGERLNDMVAGLRERDRLKQEQQRLEQELAIAWAIQSSFLPEALPPVPGWQLTATLEPARVTSGDFYDVIPLPSGHIGVLVADVADKGTGAALYMALSRTLIRTFATEHATAPARALQAANWRILQDTNSDLFVTAFYGVLDPGSGRLVYANAGHNPPYLLGAREPRPLVRTGIPLGILPDRTWDQGVAHVEPGEALLLYTDGITEAQGSSHHMFGVDRMLNAVRAQLGQPAPVMQAALLQAVRGFLGGAPLFDDMTLLIAVRGEQKTAPESAA